MATRSRKARHEAENGLQIDFERGGAMYFLAVCQSSTAPSLFFHSRKIREC